jgi:hypothetical protein
MRGLHGTLAVDSGITSHAVASALGHESFKTTAAHYAKREAFAGAQQKRALAVLTGGRRASEAATSSTPRRTTPIVPQTDFSTATEKISK